MAEYIDDIGPYNEDALFVGAKATEYDYDETNHLVWFSSTGTCTTGFTPPSDKEWILYEVYAPDSYTNNLSGGTTVQSKKEFTTDVGTVATTIAAWRTAYIAATGFTTYSLKATHFKGSNTADVYVGSNSSAFSLTGGITDGSYTPAAWVIQDTLFADEVSDATTWIALVSLQSDSSNTYTASPLGTGYVNEFTNPDINNTILDVNGDAIDNGVQFDDVISNVYSSNSLTAETTTNTGYIYDRQYYQNWYVVVDVASAHTVTMSGFDTGGTYTIKMAGVALGANDWEPSIVLDSTTGTWNGENSNFSAGFTWAGVTPNGSGEISFTWARKAGETAGMIGGIIIERTA